MTDKEFKRLSRAQLIEIIYQLQLQVDALEERNKALETSLEDKRLRIENAGNIAEAALVVNDWFQTAQNAADQYLAEIKALYAEAETQRQKILADAQAEARELVANAQKPQNDYCAIIEAIMKEHEEKKPNNG